jgi:hypothetical protein
MMKEPAVEADNNAAAPATLLILIGIGAANAKPARRIGNDIIQKKY